ncbi:MAG: PilZ domain-containing protein [Candidatus Hydrogenedentes bacterium]|nr:PilZ domain-containing protein [Candidatus Hydrogenedentota bacterium]
MSGLCSEKRRGVRRAKSVSAWLRFRSEKAHWGTVTLDVGTGGARFTAERPVEVGEHVLLTVQLEPSKDRIECKGHVTWSKQQEDGTYRFGVRFVDLNEDESAALERFVSDTGEVITFALR